MTEWSAPPVESDLGTWGGTCRFPSAADVRLHPSQPQPRRQAGLEPTANLSYSFIMAAPPDIGAKAKAPNPALAPLAFLIGEWRTMGSHPMWPGKALKGRTEFAWHEGGAFLIMHGQVDEPQFPDGVAIVGSDDATGRFAMGYFDERGTSRLMDVTVGERSLTWIRDTPEFSQRLTIAAEGDRLVSQGQMSRNGGPWEDDLSQTFERA